VGQKRLKLTRKPVVHIFTFSCSSYSCTATSCSHWSMVSVHALRSSCCLIVVLARASAKAYNSWAPAISFWALVLSLPRAISSFVSRDYFSSNQSRFSTAFYFLEAVRSFSRDPHFRRLARSSSRFLFSQRNMSRFCYSVKRAVPTASGMETYLGAPRPGCPMMNSGSSMTSSLTAAEAVVVATWDTEGAA
jgi:uncharacterized membrane protein